MKPNRDLSAGALGPGIIPWPDGVAHATGMSAMTLQRKRAQGDAPKLYAVSERNLVTTAADLLAWVQAKAVPPSYKCRPATVRGRRVEKSTTRSQP